LYGAYCAEGEIQFEVAEHCNIIAKYRMNDEREAILENGDVIKYKKGKYLKEPEWIFSPRIDWDRMHEEVIKQINDCNCMWDYNGKIIEDENYTDPETGWKDQIFIMKSSGEWKFRIAPHRWIYKDYWKPFSPPKPKKKFC
jgi:hypothetical protein